jgi:hypothetical protein
MAKQDDDYDYLFKGESPPPTPHFNRIPYAAVAAAAAAAAAATPPLSGAVR